MAEPGRRRARAFAPFLVFLAVVLLALLAFNLRNLDPGSEELPPPPVTEEPPEVVAQEGAGNALRALYTYFIALLILVVFVGGLLMGLRGVKFSKLFSPWELLGFLLAAVVLVLAFVYWDSVLAALEAVFSGLSGGDPPPGTTPGNGTGDPPSLPTATGPASIALYAIVALATVYVIVFAVAFLPKLYRTVSLREPDAGRGRRELARAVRTAIKDLESGEDLRAAVLRCYKTMVLLFESRGMRQEPHQTAREWEAEALGGMGVSPDSIEDLTSLFEEARYSTHPIGVPQRDRALSSLASIRTELEASA